MANRQNRPPPAAAIPSSARQNEYFVPRDGIDREVITSDICRYLGNDALVRPGTYESPDGRVTQGYFITAYRNLTSAMIQDLKADSARWEQERRAASRTGGGSREQNRGGPADYTSWKNRQLDTSSTNNYTTAAMNMDRMDVDYPQAAPPAPNPYANPYQAPGYPQAAYPPQVHGGPAQYAQNPYGYQVPPPPPAAHYSPGPPPGADSRYPNMAAPQSIPQGYPQDQAVPAAVPFVHGSNYSQAGYPAPGPNRMNPMSMSSAPPSRAFNALAGPGGYGAEPDAFNNYGAAGNVPSQSYPVDSAYGRAPGGPAPPRPYGAVPDPQFVDERQSPGLPNAPTPTNGTPSQIPATGPPPPRREGEPREREREREHREHRARRSEPDREDRHAAERARHRHGHR